MRHCAVLNCNKTCSDEFGREKMDFEKNFYNFPMDAILSLAWKRSLKLTEYSTVSLQRKFVVCKDHFKPTDFHNGKDGRLKANAIPTMKSMEKREDDNKPAVVIFEKLDNIRYLDDDDDDDNPSGAFKLVPLGTVAHVDPVSPVKVEVLNKEMLEELSFFSSTSPSNKKDNKNSKSENMEDKTHKASTSTGMTASVSCEITPKKNEQANIRRSTSSDMILVSPTATDRPTSSPAAAKSSTDAAKTPRGDARKSTDAAKPSTDASKSMDAAKPTKGDANSSADASKQPKDDAKSSTEAAKSSTDVEKSSTDPSKHSKSDAKSSTEVAKSPKCDAKSSTDPSKHSKSDAKSSTDAAKPPKGDSKSSTDTAKSPSTKKMQSLYDLAKTSATDAAKSSTDGTKPPTDAEKSPNAAKLPAKKLKCVDCENGVIPHFCINYTREILYEMVLEQRRTIDQQKSDISCYRAWQHRLLKFVDHMNQEFMNVEPSPKSQKTRGTSMGKETRTDAANGKETASTSKASAVAKASTANATVAAAAAAAAAEPTNKGKKGAATVATATATEANAATAAAAKSEAGAKTVRF